MVVSPTLSAQRNATCETARARTKPERQDACVSSRRHTTMCKTARPNRNRMEAERRTALRVASKLLTGISRAPGRGLGEPRLCPSFGCCTRCCTSHTWWRNTAAGTVPRLLGNERRHLPAKPCTVTLGWPKDGQADGLAQRSTRSLAHSPWRLPCMQARRMRACHARAAHPLLDALGCVGCGVRTPSWSRRARGHERKS